ncbi:hypothetical protein FRC17_000905 [Serendipita sp. 399]|nr:hypothetical protein FRC17_000905 [Serendipita sp. 399]
MSQNPVNASGLSAQQRFLEEFLKCDETDEPWGDGHDAMAIEQNLNDITVRYTFQIAHEPLRPGGNLIYPCDSCAPGNSTGYECSWPIPMPTPEQLLQEIERTGRSIRVPGPGEPRAPLSDFDDV